MPKGILGKKIGMLSLWDDNGQRIPVTAVEAGPCYVVQVKTPEKDGYSAIQIGFGEKREKLISKPSLGHLKASVEKGSSLIRHLVEVRDYNEDVSVGDILSCSLFNEGEKVFVRSKSKGKGFQGVVKRYNFGGGRKTHGSTFHRSTGSIGAGTYPGEVAKGKKMPGHMGQKLITHKQIELIKVVKEDNLVFLKGNVPGAKGSLVYIYQK